MKVNIETIFGGSYGMFSDNVNDFIGLFLDLDSCKDGDFWFEDNNREFGWLEDSEGYGLKIRMCDGLILDK